MSLNIPNASVVHGGPSRNISAIYHMEEEKFFTQEVIVASTPKVKEPEEYYKFYRKGVEQKNTKRSSMNMDERFRFESGTIHLRSVLPEKGTEASYAESDFNSVIPIKPNSCQLKPKSDLKSVGELTRKYFDCERVSVDVDDSLATEKVGKVSKLLQNRVHESFMKEFWALQYHYPKDHFKKVGDGIKKPAPCMRDFEPSSEDIVNRRKRTKILAVPKYIVQKKEKSQFKLPAVESTNQLTKSSSNQKSIYGLLPQPEHSIVEIKTIESLALSVNLDTKPYVGSAGKRALISQLGLTETEKMYSDKADLQSPNESSTPKSRRKERTHKDIAADLHREFQILAKSNKTSICYSSFHKELFNELPKCLRGHLEEVVTILKKPMYERRKVDVACLKACLHPLK
ncbi:UNVERIFIED_CONTAM: hypothetical protein HDU68_009680 [Siphonaria sp. JEL0065]|nr:hypothetical protein HDU68_009680 [Siphonaria sp. JEL0065]